MIFKRKVYKEMEKWKNSLSFSKTALVIKGLRQVGKTTIAKEFAKNNYENVVYFNFMEDDELRDIFKSNLNVNRLIRDLSSYMGEDDFVPYKTVFIFDEIQECSSARLSIKPFMIDGRYDIIATGSLMGLRGYNLYSRGIPVGFETRITMHPMDFEEYLWAKKVKQELLDYIKDCFFKKEKVSDVTNKVFMNHFKEYLCVGGMPNVVKKFLSTNNLKEVLELQRNILTTYEDDFGKHLDKEENKKTDKRLSTKIMQVYNSIPAQLARENKKFFYSLVDKDASAREHLDAITWLEEYGLISLCYNLKALELPLEGNKNLNAFKIYVADTGLFVAMLEPGTTRNILKGNLKIYKGAIYENVIADAFIKLDKKLYYYKNSFEIDFITRYNDEITAIEVKARSGNAKALKELISNDKYDVKANFKLIDGNIGTQNGINTIPLYMAYLIDD